MLQDTIYQKVEKLPESIQLEILNYIDSIKESPNLKQNTIKERPFGFAKGTFIMSLDFDEPLEDFKEYM